MAKLSDVSNPARYLIGNRNFSNGVVSAATASTALISTNAFVYTINGITYAKAALAGAALTVNTTEQPKITQRSTFYAQPAGSTAYYTIALDSSGNVYTVQGTYSGQVLQDGITLGDGSVPDCGADLCPIAVAKVALTSTGVTSWTPGQASLTAASGITTTFYNVSVLPATNP